MQDYTIPTINRAIVLLIPKQPFFDWAASLEGGEELYESEMDMEYPSFLVDDSQEHADIYEHMIDHVGVVFEEMLYGRCVDESLWPAQRDMKLFRAWFDLKYSSVLFDLADHLELMHDDEEDDFQDIEDIFDEDQPPSDPDSTPVIPIGRPRK